MSERNRHNRLKLMKEWPELHDALDRMVKAQGGVYVPGLINYSDPDFEPLATS